MGRLKAWREANNFALYYGRGKTEQLTAFDVAIVEPQGQTPADLAQLQSAGTLTLAYVSVMEVRKDSPWYNRLSPDDHLMLGGEPFMNRAFATYVMDLRSVRWIGLLHHQIGKLLHAGYDGIFLDTIGDVESYELDPMLRRTQVEAASALLRSLKQAFPRHLLVQNNGLETLISHSAPWIDGVCWENPPFGLAESAAWVEVILQRLAEANREHLVRTLLLLESDTGSMESPAVNMAKDVAAARRCLLYVASPGYTADVLSPITTSII